MLFQKECLIESDIVTAPDFEEIFVNTEGLNVKKMYESQKIIQQKVEDLEYRSEMYKSKRKRRLTKKEQTEVLNLLKREEVIVSELDRIITYGQFTDFSREQELLIRGIEDDSPDSPTKDPNSPQIGDPLKESQNRANESVSTPKGLENMRRLMNQKKKEPLGTKELMRYLREVRSRLEELEYNPSVDRLGVTQRTEDPSLGATSVMGTTFKTYDRQNEHVALLLCIVPKSGKNSYEEFRVYKSLQ